jgi:hypothetical protein
VKIIQKAVSAGLTINLGNYESLRIDSTVTVEISEGDDLQGVRARMLLELRDDLAATYKAFNPKGKTGEQVAATPGAQAPKQAKSLLD